MQIFFYFCHHHRYSCQFLSFFSFLCTSYPRILLNFIKATYQSKNVAFFPMPSTFYIVNAACFNRFVVIVKKLYFNKTYFFVFYVFSLFYSCCCYCNNLLWVYLNATNNTNKVRMEKRNAEKNKGKAVIGRKIDFSFFSLDKTYTV